LPSTSSTAKPAPCAPARPAASMRSLRQSRHGALGQWRARHHRSRRGWAGLRVTLQAPDQSFFDSIGYRPEPARAPAAIGIGQDCRDVCRVDPASVRQLARGRVPTGRLQCRSPPAWCRARD
jgi:hypothetical protein